MANHMAEVAKMLGVELGEEFEIKEYGLCQFRFKETCFQYFNGKMWVSDLNTQSDLYELLTGQLMIKRKPWKPEYGETYWYVEKDGDIWEREWHPCRHMSDHMNRYKLGNCYRTREEAEANRDKWVTFYASDEVLEV